MENKIIFTLPDVINPSGKRLLLKNGVIVVEVEDFSKVKVLNDIDFFTQDDLLLSALDALNYGNYSQINKAAFADLFIKKIQSKNKLK